MNERTIFLSALELKSPPERVAYLDQACAGNVELRERVESLLKAHEQEHGLVDALAGADERTSAMLPRDAAFPPELDVDPHDLSFLGPSPSPDGIGSLGSYEILEVLGRGGMGEVLKARDPKLQRIVAIKVLAPEIAANKTAKKRFEREAQAAAAVSHDHIVTIHAVDEYNGLPFIVMECIVGRTLQQKIEEAGEMELKEILRIGMQAAQGLAAAHKQGLVHRDIKPGNILLQNGIQRVKITDFGLARATDDVGMTHTGQIAGTPMYMSPEQAQGEKVDHLSDLFSLGSVLYTMCTGRPAFRANSIVAALRRVIDDTPRPIRDVNPDLPDWLVEIVNKLLAKDKKKRYQTAADVADILSQKLTLLQEPRSSPVLSSTSDAATTAYAPAVNQPVSVFQVSPQPKTIWPWVTLIVAFLLLGVWGIDRFVIKSAATSSTNSTARPTSTVSETSMMTASTNTGWHGWPADAPKPAIAPFNAEQAKKHQEKWAAYLKAPVEYTNSIGMKLRLIPPGEFLVGSTKDEIDAALRDVGDDKHWRNCINSESPQHRVILTQPIYLGVNEVTQAEYVKMMGSNPSHFAPMGMGKEAVAGLDTANHPVEMVNWNEAAEFCVKLSKQEKLKPFYFRAGETTTALDGTGYRLPSEAEWEFACRAGTTMKYWIGDGDEELVRVGWFRGNSGGRTHAAGELRSNPFGLYDIHGNAWEWVQDGWDASYYGQYQHKSAIDPSAPFTAGSQRVIRGGLWVDSASLCQSSRRYAVDPSLRHYGFGFRVSLVVDAVRQTLKVAGPMDASPETIALGADPDRNAAEWVLSIGGTVRVNDQQSDLNQREQLPKGPFKLTGIGLRGNPQATDDGLAHFASCRNLKVVNLYGTPVGDAGVAHLKENRGIEALILHSTPRVTNAGLAHFQSYQTLLDLDLWDADRVTDEGLLNFKDCRKLQRLTLVGTGVSDEGLAIFKDCSDLTYIDLSGAHVGDTGLANFKGLRQLTYLGLQSTRVTDEVLACFKDCSRLIGLNLAYTEIGDDGLASLKDLRNVTELRLVSTNVTNAGLEHLGKYRVLKALNLSGTQVTRAGLVHLKRCQDLELLQLQKTKIAEDDLKDFKKELPNCHIEWDGGRI